ncbi:MAG TPA: hypothetical protein VMF58_18220 [Rhizomicrobium sp.]|nr:hypothetical protein [Rhizomicrobium sp.]
MRLRLDYDDQNEELRALLPVSGTVVKRVKSAGHGEWDVFQQDEPLAYRQVQYDRLLLRSRTVGRAIGDPDAVSVFLAVARELKDISDGFDFDKKDFIGWGMVTLSA